MEVSLDRMYLPVIEEKSDREVQGEPLHLEFCILS